MWDSNDSKSQTLSAAQLWVSFRVSKEDDELLEELTRQRAPARRSAVAREVFKKGLKLLQAERTGR